MPTEQLASAEGTSYNGPMVEERILIVDDDREIVRLLRSYLQRERYVVSVAYDGETALNALRRESPALVLLDLMLPDKDGWEITRAVRGDEKLANTLIIMLTARVEDTDKIIGLELVRTIMSPSRSIPAKWWRGCGRSCGVRSGRRRGRRRWLLAVYRWMWSAGTCRCGAQPQN